MHTTAYIVPHFLPKKRPQIPHQKKIPVINPLRQLATIVVLQAIFDSFYPRQSAGYLNRQSALEFINSATCREILEELSIPASKISLLVNFIESFQGDDLELFDAILHSWRAS